MVYMASASVFWRVYSHDLVFFCIALVDLVMSYHIIPVDSILLSHPRIISSFLRHIVVVP